MSETVPTLRSRLEALQCHFTWDLDENRAKLLRLKDRLEDIGTEEGNCWLGHSYNLQGYVQYHLGSQDEAGDLLSRAEEALRHTRNGEEGPWLVVNYGNRAWLHHLRGQEAESRDLLSKVDALTGEHPAPAPAPSQDELHPEVCAEKAWTLMKFSRDQRLQAAGLFERVVEMQPDRVEWETSHILGLLNTFKHEPTGLEPGILDRMRRAKERDPENLYLAVHYLEQVAKTGESVEDEALELAEKILRNPVSSYGGLKALLRVYRHHVSIDEAVDLAEEALRGHPGHRYLTRCAALCYKWKVLFVHESRPAKATLDRAVGLHEEVIALYPHSSFVKTIELANILAKSPGGLSRAEQTYRQLLERQLEPADRQLLYNNYAKYLNYDRQERHRSIEYHMKAAAIPQESYFRENSIRVLERIRDRNKNRMCGEIDRFLAGLPDL